MKKFGSLIKEPKFSLTVLIFFGLVFAVTGIYIIYHSRAATTLNTPALVLPADGNILVSKRPTIRWGAISGASGYDFELYQDDSLVKSVRVTTNSYTPAFDLTDKGNYYWRVKAVVTTAAYNSDQSTRVAAMLTATSSTAPLAPALLSPSNNQHFSTSTTYVSLDWSDVSGCKYVYQSSKSTATNPDGSFANPAHTSGQLTASGTTATGLSPNTYYWHIQSVNSSGAKSAWSAFSQYTIDAPAPTTPAPVPTTPTPAPTTVVSAESYYSPYWNFSIDTTRTSDFMMPNPASRWTGAYVNGNAAAFTSFENLVGKKQQLSMNFKSFYWDANFPSTDALTYYNKGTHYAVTWEPWKPGSGSRQPQFSNTAMANNQTFTNSAGSQVHFDDYIKTWATQIKAYKKPVYIRFAHEMNGGWYPWGKANGNTTTGYIQMWKHVHDIFARNGVKNVRWVWCVNNYPTSTIASYYPGDNYVDVASIDGYNWGNTPGYTWTEFKYIFNTPYSTITALTKKDIWLAETASIEGGGNKATWITNAYNYALASYPKVRMISWFDGSSWNVDSSNASLASFKSAVQLFK